MPRRPRIKLAGMPQHIVQRGINREPCFFVEEDYHFYLHWLEKSAADWHCRIHAYALMTNHVHLLVTPETETGIAKLMQAIGRRYVQYINRSYRRTGSLWGRDASVSRFARPRESGVRRNDRGDRQARRSSWPTRDHKPILDFERAKMKMTLSRKMNVMLTPLIAFRFGAGVNKDNIKLHLGSLLLDLGNGDAVHIGNFDQNDVFNSSSISGLEFADGSTLSTTELLARGFDLDGTAGDALVEAANNANYEHHCKGRAA